MGCLPFSFIWQAILFGDIFPLVCSAHPIHLQTNAGIFGKVYFPRLSVPVSIVISNLISFSIRLGIFVAFLIYFLLAGSTVRPNLWILLLPVLLLIMAGLGLGVRYHRFISHDEIS